MDGSWIRGSRAGPSDPGSEESGRVHRIVATGCLPITRCCKYYTRSPPTNSQHACVTDQQPRQRHAKPTMYVIQAFARIAPPTPCGPHSLTSSRTLLQNHVMKSLSAIASPSPTHMAATAAQVPTLATAYPSYRHTAHPSYTCSRAHKAQPSGEHVGGCYANNGY